MDGNNMDECLCLIPDENDCCTLCGKHIELPDLGDIVGICKLCDAAAFASTYYYEKAKALGYRGDLARWIEFVQERMLSQ